MEIDLTKKEMQDLLLNLYQCMSEGYLNGLDPAYSAILKLESALENSVNYRM